MTVSGVLLVFSLRCVLVIGRWPETSATVLLVLAETGRFADLALLRMVVFALRRSLWRGRSPGPTTKARTGWKRGPGSTRTPSKACASQLCVRWWLAILGPAPGDDLCSDSFPSGSSLGRPGV